MRVCIAWLAPALILTLASCAPNDILVVGGQTRDTEILATFGEPTHIVAENEDGLTEWVYSLPRYGGEFTEFKQETGDEVATSLHMHTFVDVFSFTVLRFVFDNGIVVQANASSRGR